MKRNHLNRRKRLLQCFIGILLFIICLIPFWTFSQISYQDKLFEQLREYARHNIRPVLITQRSKLDDVLTPEEKEKINDLRMELQEIKNASMESIFEISSEPILNETVILDFSIPFFYENKSLIESLLSDAWEIANHHAYIITPLMDEILKNIRIWEIDIAKIASDFNNRNSKDVSNVIFRRHINEIITPAFFLLWNENGIFFDYSKNDILQESFTKPVLKPFPVKDHVIIQFDLVRPGHFLIKLFDNRGRLLNSIDKTSAIVGTIEEEFDLSSLGSGGYFIRVISDTDSHMIRFIKE